MFIVLLTVIATALAADRIRLACMVRDLEEDLDREVATGISLWACLKARDQEIFRLNGKLSQPHKLG